MEDGDGVVVGLAMPLDDADGALGFGCSSKENVLKECFVDVVRAGAGKEEAAWFHFLHGVAV